MKLRFKSSKTLLYHNGPEGRIDNGEVKEYTDGEADRLLTDFPNNFEPVKAEKLKEEKPEPLKEELEEEKQEKEVAHQPDKMVKEDKPKSRKK